MNTSDFLKEETDLGKIKWIAGFLRNLLATTEKAIQEKRQNEQQIHDAVFCALRQDRFRLRITYTDQHGTVTDRIIKPVHHDRSDGKVWAYCFLRQGGRQFFLNKISAAELVTAGTFLEQVQAKREERDGAAIAAYNAYNEAQGDTRADVWNVTTEWSKNIWRKVAAAVEAAR